LVFGMASLYFVRGGLLYFYNKVFSSFIPFIIGKYNVLFSRVFRKRNISPRGGLIYGELRDFL